MATPEYGVWGYVIPKLGNPVPNDPVTVTCSCGGPGSQWQSGTDDNGYWETPFTEAEAEMHNGHNTVAQDALYGDTADFTYRAPVVGPIIIVAT